MSTHLAKRDAEHALALFKEVFTASPDAIVVTDKAGRIVAVNPASGRLFGYREYAAMVHESFHCLHCTALSAEMVEVGITALRLIPRHQGKALTGLIFLKAGDITQDEHPPVIRLQLLSAANIARERYIPDHVHLIC